MRLLQLATGPGEVLDLHPNVSIVTGLDDDGRVVLVDAVTRLARAEAASGPGLLEAHGVLFDLDPVLLSVIEGTDNEIDPIVHPVQLPTQPISLDARELRSREEAFAVLLELIAAQAEKQSLARGAVATALAALEQARRARADAAAGGSRRKDDLDRMAHRLEELADERRRIRREAHDVRVALRSAHVARSEVERRTSGVRDAKDAAIALRASIEAELAEVDQSRHGDEAVAVEQAAAALERLEAEVEAARARDVAEGRAAGASAVATGVGVLDPQRAAERLERLEERERELDHLLAVVTPVDRMAVEQALALLNGGQSVDLVPSNEAARLADELDRISAELGDPAQSAEEGVGDASLADARSRLDDARQALLEAERALRSPDLDRDEVLRLEDIHAELVEATEKADGRFGRARAESRVAELRAAEQELLDRLGFASYSAYMIGYSLDDIDPAKEAVLDRARLELAAAEDDWRALEREAESALKRAAVLDRRRELVQHAGALVGRIAPGTRPQDALRALRVPAVSPRESARVIRAALDGVGVELGDEDLDREELALIAEAWLDEADQVDGRRRAAFDELAAVQAERVTVSAQVQGAAQGDPAPGDAAPAAARPADGGPDSRDVERFVDTEPEARRLERLAAARAALDAAQARMAARWTLEARRGALARDLATALEMERSAADASREAEEEVSSAFARETELAERAGALDDALVAADRAIEEAEHAFGELSSNALDLPALDAQLEAAEAVHLEAAARLDQVDRALATLDEEGSAAALAIERLQDLVAGQGTGTATPAEELEWYLLARLAAQRAVSVAGSVPLLLDDALRGLDAEEVCHLLSRLERMAEVVQVIVISQDPVVAAWAVEAGPARAAVVSPGAG